MHIIPVTPSMFVLLKKGDNPDLRSMQMKHQKDATKKYKNLHKSEARLLQTVWYTHVDIKSTRLLFIFFSLAIFAVHTHHLHLPPLPGVFLT